MNALRKILNNLQKYATTVTPVKLKNDNSVTPLLPQKRSPEETDLHKETPGSEIVVNAATPPMIGTDESLKEFDDILEEISKDVAKGASLDDIDEVLKDRTQEDPKDFVLEVPRFDLAEISAAFEYLKDDNADINSLISLDDSIVSLSDDFIANINEDIEQNDVISISSEGSQPEDSVKNIATENRGNIEQNTDVNSTNNEETKENRKHTKSIEYKKLDNKYISDEKYQGIKKQTTSNETNDVEAKTNEHRDKTNEHRDKTNEPTDKTNEPIDKTNEGIQNNPVESYEEVNDLTTKDVVFMDELDDCGYQSSDFEFITEEEAKMDGLIIKFKKNTHKRKADRVNRVKTIEVAVDQFSNAKKSPKRKKIKRKNIDKDPDWAPESDTDSISDDEFITDDEFVPNNMEYRNGNNTRSKNNTSSAKSPGKNISTFSLRQIRIPPKTYNSSLRFGNLQINSDSQSRNTEYNLIQNKEQRDNPDKNNDQNFNNECRNELATVKIVCNVSNSLQTDLKTAQIDYPNANFNHDLPEKVPDSNKIIPGSSFIQQNHHESKNIVIKTNDMQVGVLNFNQDLPEKVPDPNKGIPGSSFMQEKHPDSNNMVNIINNIGPTLNIPEENNVHPGPSHSQKSKESVFPGTSRENVPDSNTIPGTSRENVPDSNTIPGTSRENVPETSRENIPDPNNLNPGPSGMQANLGLNNFDPGPSCKRNRSHFDEIEKWRMYQMRNRLKRPQFVVDYSYRDHHSVFQDQDLHQLFDPNRAPLLTARSMRLMENKSTVCKNSMLVEYQGLGFDVPVRDNESEDDEVKQEANECAQKILEMYSGANPRRPRRHRRF